MFESRSWFYYYMIYRVFCGKLVLLRYCHFSVSFVNQSNWNMYLKFLLVTSIWSFSFRWNLLLSRSKITIPLSNYLGEGNNLVHLQLERITSYSTPRHSLMIAHKVSIMRVFSLWRQLYHHLLLYKLLMLPGVIVVSNFLLRIVKWFI